MSFSLSGVMAQQSVVSSGGDINGTGGSISYSIGQLAYSAHIGENGSITEGVQQAYEISVISGIEINNINLEISAFPNPTNDYLNLNIKNKEFNNLSFYLFDNNGRILHNVEIKSNTTQIDMSSYPPAVYFIKITSNEKEIKNFKIIKN